ncbi:hypothetical protein F4809DRAFT_657269 [Biscogniauxia mediterranea]|nr:hypothetical protein F4809DRAFT_657269 [Biscogniauxia mediterranea]
MDGIQNNAEKIADSLLLLERPDMLFRVIGRGGRWPNIGFDEDGNLLPESYPTGPFKHVDFEKHLIWDPVPTPFISLYGDWDAAKWRVKRFIEDWKAKEVDIVVVWTRDLDCLYGAEDIARKLKEAGRSAMDGKKIWWYKHEYLYARPILECRLLVVHTINIGDYDDFKQSEPRIKEWTTTFFRSGNN